jgi:probable addiction module antidote protein
MTEKEFDIQDYLATSTDRRLFLKECIKQDPGDGSLIAAALKDVAEATGIAVVAEAVGMTERNLTKALSKSNLLPFVTALQVMFVAGVKLEGKNVKQPKKAKNEKAEEAKEPAAPAEEQKAAEAPEAAKAEEPKQEAKAKKDKKVKKDKKAKKVKKEKAPKKGKKAKKGTVEPAEAGVAKAEVAEGK